MNRERPLVRGRWFALVHVFYAIAVAAAIPLVFSWEFPSSYILVGYALILSGPLVFFILGYCAYRFCPRPSDRWLTALGVSLFHSTANSSLTFALTIMIYLVLGVI